tara:strand:- start:6705 stop:7016 length:312 start_codon:yes stop_codon:yes gene_type:complete
MSKDSKATSLLAKSLKEDENILKYVDEQKEEGRFEKVPDKIKRRYYSIKNSSRKNRNYEYESDDDIESEKKIIEKITRRPFTKRRGGKTKRKRRNKKSRKRKN